MGIFKRLLGSLGIGKQQVRILCVGLDNSGKTTILKHLTPKKAEVTNVRPTVGFNVEEFTKGNLSFICYDMSGQGRYRNLWEAYYKDCQGIIFVIDASEQIRMCVAKDELEALLRHEDVGDVPIVFFANKMDINGALSAVDCVTALELTQITGKAWHIVSSNALTGEGLEMGIGWLAEQIAKKAK
eukprot:GFYU01001927.1.p2 GENE.GFYU01001927.1~~GFYU01001927.1.p2  ORF type:complete len:185 (-),score=46.30 GFYU01001927.1:86-640(-)